MWAHQTPPAPTGQREGGSNSRKTLNAPRLEEHHWHHAWVCRSRTPSLHAPHLPSPGPSLESTVFTGVPPSLLGLQGGEECNLGSRCRATVRGQGKRGSHQSFCPETLSQLETDACPSIGNARVLADQPGRLTTKTWGEMDVLGPKQVMAR